MCGRCCAARLADVVSFVLITSAKTHRKKIWQPARTAPPSRQHSSGQRADARDGKSKREEALLSGTDLQLNSRTECEKADALPFWAL